MGRTPTRWVHLPKGMRARPRGNKIFYYLDTGEKPRREIPLGSDLVEATAKWAELQVRPKTQKTVITLIDAIDGRGDCRGYRKDVMPRKAPRTRSGNEIEIEFLLKFFGKPPAPLAEIEPMHVSQYMTWRLAEARRLEEGKNAERRSKLRAEKPIPSDIGHVRANREKALLSHIWNYARAQGLTSAANPCKGIESFKETGRETAPDDAMVQLVQEHADVPAAFALRLAAITGQRPADVLRMSEAHIEGAIPGGILHVRQGKTSAKLRIVIEGAIADLLLETLAYKRTVVTPNLVWPLALLVNDKGKALTKDMLRKRFDAAREKAGVEKSLFQFRDLRAKAATETDDVVGIRAAQALLGHTTEGMTADYIRHKVGKKVRLMR